MLRKATEEDLSALVALRCKAAGTNRADAAGWLQNVAGLENILVLEKNGQPPAAMLAAVPVEYGQHHGIWLCGAAGAQGVPLDRLLPKWIESCLRAYGASGFDFAVMTSDGTQNAETLKTLGFAGQLPLRLLHPAKALPVLQANGLPTATVGEDNTIALPPLRDDLLAGLVQALADSGAGVVGLTQHTRTLEEIFLTLTAPKEVG